MQLGVKTAMIGVVVLEQAYPFKLSKLSEHKQENDMKAQLEKRRGFVLLHHMFTVMRQHVGE